MTTRSRAASPRPAPAGATLGLSARRARAARAGCGAQPGRDLDAIGHARFGYGKPYTPLRSAAGRCAPCGEPDRTAWIDGDNPLTDVARSRMTSVGLPDQSASCSIERSATGRRTATLLEAAELSSARVIGRRRCAVAQRRLPRCRRWRLASVTNGVRGCATARLYLVCGAGGDGRDLRASSTRRCAAASTSCSCARRTRERRGAAARGARRSARRATRTARCSC